MVSGREWVFIVSVSVELTTEIDWTKSIKISKFSWYYQKYTKTIFLFYCVQLVFMWCTLSVSVTNDPYDPYRAVSIILLCGCSLLWWPLVIAGAHNIALQFADQYGSLDPSGDSQEKAILYIDLLVAAGRLSDAVTVTRAKKQSVDDLEIFNCFLDKCQQGIYL